MNLRTVRHIAQQAAIVGMEALAFAVLLYQIGARDSTIPVLPFLLVGWSMLAFNRWLSGLEIWESVQGRGLSLLSLLVGTSLLMGLLSDEIGLFASPVVMVAASGDLARYFSGNGPLTGALFGGVILYYRVLVTVGENVGVIGVGRRVLWALGVFLWIIFLMDVQSGGIQWNVLLAFVALALLSFILSRTHELNQIPGVGALPVTARRAGIFLAITLVTLSAGSFLQAFAVDPLRRVGGWLQPLFSVLLILLALPLRLILMLLDPLLQRLADEWQIEVLTPPTVPGAEGSADPMSINPTAWGPELIYLLMGIGAFIVIALIFLQTYRRFNNRSVTLRGQAAAHEAGERAQWLPFSFRNPFRQRADYGIETVRDLYKNVLIFGDNRGVPRAADDTPYEYLEPLSAKYPTVRSEFEALTNAYVATHYGEIRFSRDEIRKLQAAWQKIKSLPAG